MSLHGGQSPTPTLSGFSSSDTLTSSTLSVLSYAVVTHCGASVTRRFMEGAVRITLASSRPKRKRAHDLCCLPLVRPLPEMDLRDMLGQLCQGLDFLHRQHIVHNDIRAENLLWHQGQVKIIDFGCAKFYGHEGEQDISVGSGVCIHVHGPSLVALFDTSSACSPNILIQPGGRGPRHTALEDHASTYT